MKFLPRFPLAKMHASLRKRESKNPRARWGCWDILWPLGTPQMANDDGHHRLRECNSVTESELVLLAAQQADKSRDELLGQRIATLFGKLAC